MKTVSNDGQRISYGESRALLLWLGLVCAAGVVVANVLEFSLTAQLALGVIAIVGILVGGFSTQVEFNLAERRMVFKRAFVRHVTSRVDAPFDAIAAVLVFGGAPDTHVQRQDFRASYRVVLSCDVAQEPITIGVFPTQQEALDEAAFLAQRLGVQVRSISE